MPFDINGGEFLVILLLAALLLGPDRLPELARGAARLVRRGRDFATGASAQMKDEMGVDLDGVDWRRYDPRQYHPRRIVQNALSDAFDDEDTPSQRRKATTAAAKRTEAGRPSGSTSLTKAATGSPAAPPARPTGSSGATGASARGGREKTGPQTVRTSTSAVPRRPSPPPTTWADAARRAGVDTDAT
ncbi:twin-arginine translocase TatA/TatE family subunit [Aquipuribacter hungaricus]|uniref:Twin-arginine translocase TatA/TatE family subunit n=1 Tax=Aquipuribacter hungaricus TaxID=545624 RepID=A0ABV7WBX1_9MICO